MKVAILFRVCWVLALLGVATAASAQSAWQVQAPRTTGKHFFTSLSCKGRSCTAAALFEYDSVHVIRIVFERTDDGGRTWRLQDPGLPNELGLNQNRIGVVDQIDSLNIVAIGDTGLFVRSTDGGESWNKLDVGVTDLLQDVHFCDPLTGIIVAGHGTILTTIDGGKHWSRTDIPTGTYLCQCHSYGPRKYRAFGYGAGPIYETSDNWKTFDSTNLVYDSKSDRGSKILGHCEFSSGDTLVAYGNRFFGANAYALIDRSTDGGTHWTEVLDSDRVRGSVLYMSVSNRDTIVAAGGIFNKVLVSADRGVTWGADTLLFDTIFSANFFGGVGLSLEGNLIAALGPYATELVLGRRAFSRVETFERIIYGTHVFPNPATGLVTLTTNDPLHELRVVDLLGREVIREFIPSNGRLDLNFSLFPRGIYVLLLDHNGALVRVGKVALLEK